MEFYEQAVMWYVTNSGQRFISPQYWIHDPTRKKWGSQPDFVALDLKEKAIYVIEVTGAGSAKGLADRIAGNIKQACAYLQENLQNDHVDFSRWRMKIRAFVRKDCEQEFHNQLKKAAELNTDLKAFDIHTIELEKTLCNWTWWDDKNYGVVSLEGRKVEL